ncbi:hypothetical protein KIW84_013489 [Lathyrus oleraceus]|uniref:Uncharacterized protein n=1 Tax=Pisum sativum TaxID=3888 RepID=A0A9D5BKG7_PEA|nr:hypothetical protein KIW84_013489 [Pisum sativum]
MIYAREHLEGTEEVQAQNGLEQEVYVLGQIIFLEWKHLLMLFRDHALENVYLGEYLGVNDDWMDVFASQESSLLAADVSGSK